MSKIPSRRRIPALIAALLSATLVLAACGDDDDDSGGGAGEMRSFQADNGTVEIPADPQRIVTIGSPGVFLGIGVEPVGLTSLSSSQLDQLTPEGKRAGEAATDIGSPPDIDYEKIASLEPDLIAVHLPGRVWNSGNVDEGQLTSIAPTVYVEIVNLEWKAQGGRIADAVGELDTFREDGAAYDALVADIRDEYGDLLTTTTFAILDRYVDTDDGQFHREYGSYYCSQYAKEAGLNIPGQPAEAGAVNDLVSIERLGDIAGEVDAIIYPLAPDGSGEPKPDFAPVVESNVWRALPQVADGRALGVACNTYLTYPAKIASLESLREALGTLAARG